MIPTHCNQRNPMKTAAVFILSTALLFCGFNWNLWNVAEQRWFDKHQRDSEGFVMGRLVKSRQDGIFSAGGLTGVGSPTTTPVNFRDKWPMATFEYQYSAYLDGLTFRTYSPYASATGGQGMFFSLLDRLIPASPRAKLRLFHALTSLLSALALTIIVLWFLFEFGWLAAVFVLASAVLSQWLVVFGRNLWWSIWAFYAPMAGVMYYLRSDRNPRGRHMAVFGSVVFITVFIKCLLNGYDYVTTTLIMMTAPLIYYGVRDRIETRRFLRYAITAVLGSCLAVFVSVIILCSQIAIEKGNALSGVSHVVYSLKKRSLGEVHMGKSFKPRTSRLVWGYLKGTFFDINNYVHSRNSFVSRFLFRVRYLYLIALFLLMSVILYFRRYRFVSGKQRDAVLPLICATWFSIMAPLSWLVIFKQHSYIHTHMNYIVWQMPFTLFGFAVCGLAIKGLLQDAGSTDRVSNLVNPTPHKRSPLSESHTSFS